jgi:hypothetical protein
VESRNQFEAAASTDGPGGHPEASGPDLATLRTPNAAVVALNAGWRVRDDGELQWILERRCSKPDKPAMWTGRRYHGERDSLLRSISELCGPVDVGVVETIKGWPDCYPDRRLRRNPLAGQWRTRLVAGSKPLSNLECRALAREPVGLDRELRPFPSTEQSSTRQPSEPASLSASLRVSRSATHTHGERQPILTTAGKPPAVVDPDMPPFLRRRPSGLLPLSPASNEPVYRPIAAE